MCEVQVRRTNTPLQALTLLNDAGMLEAARALAETVLAEAQTPAAQMQAIMRHVLFREATPEELNSLLSPWTEALAYYRQHPAEANALISVGQAPTRWPENEDLLAADRVAHIAALQIVASMVMNLDEAITHE